MYPIIFQDSHLLAVNKPAGLLCVPGLSEPDNLFDAVRREFANARVVHRLDMATSGLVLFALHHAAQKGLGQLFEQRQIDKRYSAIVSGVIEESSGEIHSPLLCDWERRPRQKIDWLAGKRASTWFRVERRDRARNRSRVTLIPHSGRTHQLRLHMLQLGHPILGDNFYFRGKSNSESERLLLHARELSFVHPITKQALRLCVEDAF